MIETLNKKTKITMIYTIFMAIIFIIFSVIEEKVKNLEFVAWIANITYIVLFICIFSLKKDILESSIVFMTFIFLFCNGEVFLYSLGIDMDSYIVFWNNTTEEIIRATIYFTLSFLVMGEGIIFTLREKKEDEVEISKEFNSTIRLIGYLLAIISIVPYFYKLIPAIMTALTSGYGAIYSSNQQTSGLSYITEFFIPSLLLILYSYRNEKIKRNMFFFLILIIAGLNLLTGGRGEGLSIVVILLIFYNEYIKKFKGKNLIKLFIIVILLILLISIIYNARSGNGGIKESVISTIISGENNPIVQTVAELGSTMNAWCLTDKAVPDIVDFKYGESYLASFMMIIPSTFLGGYSFATKAALDIWLQDIWNLSYGPGFNIFAETYYNFGWYGGIAFALVLGMFFGKMFNLKNKDKQKNELFKILSLIFLFNSLIIARFPFHSTIRNIFYMYILVYIMIILVYNYKMKRRI